MRPYKNYNEERLVKMLREGDVNAFDELYFRYVPRIKSFSKIYLKNPVVSEEVIQEVFIQLWEKRETLNEKLSLKSYLFQTVKHRIFNIFRQKVRELSLEESGTPEFYVSNTVENELVFFELKEKTFEIIESLPDTQKRIFKMSRLDGLKNEEISRQLNISKRTVEHHIYLAIKTLKTKLPLSKPGSLALIALVLKIMQ